MTAPPDTCWARGVDVWPPCFSLIGLVKSNVGIGTGRFLPAEKKLKPCGGCGRHLQHFSGRVELFTPSTHAHAWHRVVFFSPLNFATNAVQIGLKHCSTPATTMAHHLRSKRACVIVSVPVQTQQSQFWKNTLTKLVRKHVA